MYANTHVQTVAEDFSRRQKQEPFISRKFVTLNVLDYKRAGQSDKLRVNKIVAVVSKIANSCVGQAVMVIIIVVSVKCEQWHKSRVNNKEYLSETKHISVFTWLAINELIFKRL